MKLIEAGDYAVKAVKMAETRRGISLEGNLYFLNKKIAEFWDDGDGGPTSIQFKDDDQKDDLMSFISHEYPDTLSFEPVQTFVEALSVEFENKKLVRKDRKKRTYFGLKSEPDESGVRYVESPYKDAVVGYLSKTYGDDVSYIANELYDIYPDGVTKTFREQKGEKVYEKTSRVPAEDPEKIMVNSGETAYEIFKKEVGTDMEIQERFMVISLKKNHELISCDTAFIGTVDQTMSHPRDVFRTAVKENASYVIVAHNHPSGCLKATVDDLMVTMRLQDAGDILGIEVLDHVIITAHGYHSIVKEMEDDDKDRVPEV